MNVAAHQEKEKEKTGKRKAEEERKRATNFKEAGCCPSAVVLGAARRKNGLCENHSQGSARVSGTLGRTNSHFGLTQTGLGTTPPR